MKRRDFLIAAPCALTACGVVRDGPPPRGTAAEVAELGAALSALDPVVDPAEAARAASIAFAYSHELALRYEITDPPLIHNAKVNAGRKARGLCWHWAEDMEARLNAEGFTTLSLHRAIANADSRILIDHSTAVISPMGGEMEDGIVLDPWRKGGVLFWAPVPSDPRYTWEEREAVLRRHGRIRYVRQGDLG